MTEAFTVKKLNISQSHYGAFLCNTRAISAEQVLGYFYWTMFHAHLTNKWYDGKPCAEIVKQNMASTFLSAGVRYCRRSQTGIGTGIKSGLFILIYFLCSVYLT